MALDRDQTIRVLLSRRGQLLAQLYLQTRDMHCAEDIYQDLMLKLVKSDEVFEAEENVYRWASVAGRHAAIDALRRLGRQAITLHSDVLDLLEAESARTPADHADELEALRHCLNQLNPQARQMLEWRYRDRISGLDLARKLDRPAKSLYVTMSRIYRKLADCVRARLGGEATGA
ncbi:MAG: sigma-70 family RNA polymerase sigma factor [Planctomycetes bacterium]|nr:sigma-70 family RNA polymerase sigma factor [Planctomycetota bacterium]